ncbi:MAG TPA: LOG family protein [Candidatus Binataceae bacterium]|nr:LOG family protein [Candidatus Binataceae bacterium]
MGNRSRVVVASTGRSLARNGAGSSTLPEVAGYHFRPLVTVFGSSQARPGGRLYAHALELGRLLGNAGFNLMTGGYRGVMEAVSRGAHETGAHVVGVTMGRFKDNVNRFVMDEIRTANFYERFGWLVDRADGYIAMEGGIGTLAEVTFTWQELHLRMLSPRPLVLIGARWRKLFDCFRRNLVPTAGVFAPIALVDTPEQATRLLSRHFREHLRGSQGVNEGRDKSADQQDRIDRH